MSEYRTAIGTRLSTRSSNKLITYDELKKEYGMFEFPKCELELGGKSFAENKSGFIISDVAVVLSCTYEAAYALCRIYNITEKDGKYNMKDLSKWAGLGMEAKLSLGYGETMRPVFHGFVSELRFFSDEVSGIGAELEILDVKALLMASCNAKNLVAKNYSQAVKEVLQELFTGAAGSAGIVQSMKVSMPSQSETGDPELMRNVEMNSESDYEFLLRAAKKFNCEFFTSLGTVYFRKFREDADIIAELSPGEGVRSWDISYNMTGLVEIVEVRGTDDASGSPLNLKSKLPMKFGKKSRAKDFIKGTRKVYIDPSIKDKTEGEHRLAQICSNIAERFGDLTIRTVGIPDLSPGNYILLSGFGDGVDNRFYIRTVEHRLGDDGFETTLSGVCEGIV